MDFSFTSEQEDLRRAVRDLSVRGGVGADPRRALDGTSTYDAELWKLACEQLGLPAIGVAEQHGGVGGSWVDVAVVLEEAGRALLPAPLLATMTAAAAIGRCEGAAAAELLAPLAEGSRVAALGVGEVRADDQGRLTGRVEHVLDGHVADLLVVAAGGGLFAVAAEAAGVTRTAVPPLDHTRWQASYDLADAPATSLGDATAAATAVDLLRVALAVEAVGGARRCLDMTVEHLKTRVQFGRPIGSFQALKHRAADLAVELEAAASTAYYAAWAAADSPDELPVVAPLAKAVCGEAFFHLAAETIQLHGGIGFTWEHDAHLYFKRATATRLLLGDAAAQRRLVAARAGLSAP
jgi:alkylation response protein AidB-like acyl-CoA dehydrogenase